MTVEVEARRLAALNEASYDQTRPKQWLILLMIALCIHLIAILLPWDQIFPARETRVLNPVDITEVDPAQLNALKQKWRQKQFVLPQDESVPPQDQPKPENAEFASDRNQKVREQTRARQTDVLPRPGGAQPSAPAQQQKRRQDQARPLPDLKNLGIPLAQNKDQETSPPVQSAQQDYRAQNLGRDDLKEGDQNILNTEQVVYYSYYSRLYRQIAPNWSSRIRNLRYSQRILPGSYLTQVEVYFDSKGTLTRIVYLQRSGIPEFDQAVEFAWKQIRQFPNPPRDLLDSRGEIKTGWSFRVDVSSSSQFQYSDPQRDY